MNICGEKIKKERRKAGLGQVDLSAALKVEHGLTIDQSDVSEIERGIRGVKDYELKAIAIILGVTPNDLL